MPTYDYQCKACGQQFEVSQKITEKPLLQCPSCKHQCLERGIGGGSATFRFLGEGFYINDYKNSCAQDSKSSSCPCKNRE